MIELLQRVCDGYMCGPRECYNKHIHKFFQRVGLVAVSGDHGSLDMDPLPLGYLTLDDKLMNATRRQFERVARQKRYQATSDLNFDC